MDLSQPDIDPLDLSVQRIQLSDESIQGKARVTRQFFSYLVQLRNEGIDPVPTLCNDNPILS